MGETTDFRKTGMQDNALLNQALAHAAKLNRATSPGREAQALVPQAGAALAGGDTEKAISLCLALLQAEPGFAAGWSLLGAALNRQDDHETSLICHRMAARLAPGFAEGHFSLAQALLAAGDRDAAIDGLHNVVRLAPTHARAWFLLGTLMNNTGAHGEALAAHETVTRLAPTAASHLGRGNALRGLGRLAEAAQAYQDAVALAPQSAEARTNLGCALKELGSLTNAEAELRHVVRQHPDFEPAWRNLGALLHMQGAFAAAIDAYRTALAQRPEDPELLGYIGVALNDLGQPTEAEPFFAAALAAAPQDAALHFNHGLARLKAGDWLTGWAEHEWRWRGIMPPHQITQPAWLGEDVAGRTILLHAEQGLGDTLHFVRYAPLLAARGATVLLEVQAPLVRLLREMPKTIPGIGHVLAVGEARPAFDLHCPLMSLPHRFDTTPDHVPNQPYLSAPPALLERWRAILPPTTHKRIGLVWAGSPRPNELASHYVDRRRSLDLEQLMPVLAVPGVAWINLQIGAKAAQLTTTPNLPPITDLTASIIDFADTAALIAQLDAVVAVDTSVAHLAGGMGVPILMLSRADGCWRWLDQGDTTPWYPSMRIFRQIQGEDWQAPIAAMAEYIRSGMM